jgi:hypothetical protein
MKPTLNMKNAVRCATALSLALGLATAYAADGDKTTAPAQPMTGKQKATTIGAASGAVAGAVVGGPVGAVVGGGIGAYVGHEGTDSHGRVTNANTTSPHGSDSTVRKAQTALNDQGYNAGAVDGRLGPSTQSAVRSFQAKSGLTETGNLDDPTLKALGVN